MRHRSFFLAIAALLVAIAASPAVADIRYVYDDLGRLLAVIDEASDTAVYRYDPVGNMLAIERWPTSTLAILDFRPKRGPVGTSVTLQGTGFSGVATSNAVSFNGTPATVTAATPTELTVTVPAGATSGDLAVTVGPATASSATAFEVTAAAEAPTITGFDPAVGAAGTAVTVTGTGFDPVPTNDKLAFNVTRRQLASVSSATATSLASSVPTGATSGKLWLATPGGTAQTADDFFVPPSPYSAAHVVFTGRIEIGGGNLTVAIGTANKIGLVVFEGLAGQRLSLGLSNHTMGGANVTVYRPDGVQHASQFVGSSAGALDMAPLPMAGTYQVAVVPNNPNTGSTTLWLSEEITGTITIGGPEVALTLARPGQRARLTFEGMAGQRLNVGFTNVSVTNITSVLNPDGSALVSGGGNNNQALDIPALLATGTHQLLMDPTGSNTGGLTITLSEEVTGTIDVDGASLPVALSRAGQRARITFGGTTGQRVSLGLAGWTNASAGGSASILNPDGTTLAGSIGFGTLGAAVDTPPLPTTGTYAALVDPSGVATGSVTLTLSSEVTGTITPGGAALTVSIPRAGQRARISFSGTAGQRVSLKENGLTISQGTISLLNPDGSVNGGTFVLTNFMDPRTLGSTGTHALLVDPTFAYTGAITLTLYDVPPDVTGSLTVNGATSTVTITTPGQNGVYAFAANAGTTVRPQYANSTIGCLSLILREAGGVSSAISPCTASSGFSRTLTSSGTHTITIDPAIANTGSLDLGVTSP